MSEAMAAGGMAAVDGPVGKAVVAGPAGAAVVGGSAGKSAVGEAADEEAVDRPVREAAVALVVRGEPEPAILLVRRARSARDPWSGQMALPGGRRDPEDADLCETAIRETREEVGVDLDRSALVGRLPGLRPTSRAIPRLVIAPFAFILSRHVRARVASAEIAAVYWVPVASLAAPGARSAVTVDTPAGRRRFPCYQVAGHPVWGITYRILRRFLGDDGGLSWATTEEG